MEKVRFWIRNGRIKVHRFLVFVKGSPAAPLAEAHRNLSSVLPELRRIKANTSWWYRAIPAIFSSRVYKVTMCSSVRTSQDISNETAKFPVPWQLLRIPSQSYQNDAQPHYFSRLTLPSRLSSRRSRARKSSSLYRPPHLHPPQHNLFWWDNLLNISSPGRSWRFNSIQPHQYRRKLHDRMQRICRWLGVAYLLLGGYRIQLQGACRRRCSASQYKFHIFDQWKHPT